MPIAGLRENIEGELVPGPAESLVDRETFDALQELFRENQKRRGSKSKHVHYLSGGPATCALCKQPLVARSTAKRWARVRVRERGLRQGHKEELARAYGAKELNLGEFRAAKAALEQRRNLVQWVVREVRVGPATVRGSRKFDEARFEIFWR
ncbi:hypothetical protein [Streptomyces yerevanensis]|uniref:hypothetical protein n=1 Tax=Streptomyces yerevanensis TaxID=66378 RepID=UPI0005250EF0|nr:hypothetical protein [Streptomyces yerevanensis]